MSAPAASGRPACRIRTGFSYLVYTDVKAWKSYPFKDSHNYIVTARDIRGPWTEPVYMNSIGFDTSLFHDDDGSKYFINMEWDFRRSGEETFAGILITEVDPISLEFIGEPKKVFEGTDRGLVEGPHIYKKDGWYYLDGGGLRSMSMRLRSHDRGIFSSRMSHPNKHICSVKGHPEHPIQKTRLHTSWCRYTRRKMVSGVPLRKTC